jgi:thymidine kinase
MHLTLILGPMKSGKSFDLISHFSPLKYSTSTYGLFQPVRNVRDSGIESRSGLFLEAEKIHSLKEILAKNFSVVGIDEIHMFDPSDAAYIGEMLSRGTDVIVSGLDTDYRGELFDMTKKLFELGPRDVKYKRAVCNNCKNFSATHTQVYSSGLPLTSGMPSVIPDDGTFTYEPLCRGCFVR